MMQTKFCLSVFVKNLHIHSIIPNRCILISKQQNQDKKENYIFTARPWTALWEFLTSKL